MEVVVVVFWGLENKNWEVGAGWDHQVGPIEEHLTHLSQELAEGTDSPITGQCSAVRLSS